MILLTCPLKISVIVSPSQSGSILLNLPHEDIFTMKNRVFKTTSKAKALQIVRYLNNKRIVLQHIGSAHTTEVLSDLMILAEKWIKDYSRQLSIILDENPNRLLHLSHCTFIGIKYHFFRKQIRAIQDMIKLDCLPDLL